MAKALVVSNGVSHLCLCSLDLCMIRSTEVSEIRRLIAAHVPELSGCRISVAATHTHSSPETSYLFGNTPDDPYIRTMTVKTADAVLEAFKNRVPVRMSSGSVHPRQCMRTDFRVMDTIGSNLAAAALSALEKASVQNDDTVSCASRTLSFKNRVSPAIMEKLEVGCFRLGKTIIGFVPGELLSLIEMAGQLTSRC